MTVSPGVGVAHLLGEGENRFARRGHFAYEGGSHGDTWLALDLLFASPRRAQAAAGRLARALGGYRPDLVCGAMVGGALIGLWVAAELDAGFAYAEQRVSADQVLYAIPPETRARVRGKAVVLVDDAINSGMATRACLREIEAAGGRAVAVGCLIARDAAHLGRDLGLPLEALAELPWHTWSAAECPLCRSGQPLDR